MFDEIEEKIDKLSNDDKLEIVIDIISNLQGDEMIKLLNENKKNTEYYNPEYRIAENNYYYYEKINNMLINEIY